jgi:ATP-binding cassette subfamily B protein
VRSHAAFLQVRETISSMTAQIAESVSGMAVIQAFNREQAFQAEFDSANDANRRTNTHAQYLNSLFFPGIEMLGAIAMVSVLWVGGRMITDHTLSIGTLVSAVFLLSSPISTGRCSRRVPRCRRSRQCSTSRRRSATSPARR